jgi:hypothetical protein
MDNNLHPELPLPLIFANVAVSRCPSQRHSYDEIVLCCTLLGENHDKIETNLMTIVQNQSQLNHCESWPNKIQFPKRSITKLNNESNFSMTQREIKEKNELRCKKEKRSRMAKCRVEDDNLRRSSGKEENMDQKCLSTLLRKMQHNFWCWDGWRQPHRWEEEGVS